MYVFLYFNVIKYVYTYIHTYINTYVDIVCAKIYAYIYKCIQIIRSISMCTQMIWEKLSPSIYCKLSIHEGERNQIP